jgi:hypothetical protein
MGQHFLEVFYMTGKARVCWMTALGTRTESRRFLYRRHDVRNREKFRCWNQLGTPAQGAGARPLPRWRRVLSVVDHILQGARIRPDPEQNLSRLSASLESQEQPRGKTYK